jgi:hypothetical protein
MTSRNRLSIVSERRSVPWTDRLGLSELRRGQSSRQPREDQIALPVDLVGHMTWACGAGAQSMRPVAAIPRTRLRGDVASSSNKF